MNVVLSSVDPDIVLNVVKSIGCSNYIETHGQRKHLLNSVLRIPTVHVVCEILLGQFLL